MDRKTERSLEEELSFLQKIIDQQNNIIIVYSGDELIMANHQFLDFFVQPSLEAFKREFQDISNTFVRHERYFNMGKVPEGKNWIEVLMKKKDSEAIVSMLHLSDYEPKAFAVKVSKLEENSETLYVLTFTDITQFAIQANQYFYQATHDKQTGVYNRAHFFELLEAMRQDPDNEPMQGMMVSIDNFKLFNETHGHEKGDELLGDIVDTIRMHLRERDIMARLGAKEFVILLPQTDFERAKNMASAIKEAADGVDTFTDMSVESSVSLCGYDFKAEPLVFVSELDMVLHQGTAQEATQALFKS